jgi:hypothetical protein
MNPLLIIGLIVVGAALAGGVFLWAARGGAESDMGNPITEPDQPLEVVRKPSVPVIGKVQAGGEIEMMERPDSKKPRPPRG